MMKQSLTAEKPGVLRSRWLPLFVGICAVTVTLRLWRALLAQEHAQLERTIQLEAAGVKNEVVARMQARILALVRMARRWEDWGQPTQEQWEFEAELYVSHFPGYQAIAWVNPQLTRWVTPPAANEAMQDLALAFEQQRRAMELQPGLKHLPLGQAIFRWLDLSGVPQILHHGWNLPPAQSRRRNA